MRRRMIIVLLFSVSCFGALRAQNYKVTVTQVYPQDGIVYTNAFRFKKELDNAVSKQIASLSGDSRNYRVDISTPSGKEVRYVQNVTWIETVNDLLVPCSGRTRPKEAYPERTVWSGYSCRIDGSPQSEDSVELRTFIYYVVREDVPQPDTLFLEWDAAERTAEELYARRSDSSLLTVWVFERGAPGGGDDRPVLILSNREEYAFRQFMKWCESRQEAEKKRAAERMRKEMLDNLTKWRGGQHESHRGRKGRRK